MSDVWYNTAAWVQAVGTIGALVGSAWLARRESRAARQRDRQGAHDHQQIERPEENK